MQQNFVFIAGVSPPPAPPPAAGLFHSRLKQAAPPERYDFLLLHFYKQSAPNGAYYPDVKNAFDKRSGGTACL